MAIFRELGKIVHRYPGRCTDVVRYVSGGGLEGAEGLYTGGAIAYDCYPFVGVVDGRIPE